MSALEFKKLRELCDIKGGKRLPLGSDLTSSGYPYVRARDIRAGRITFDQPVYIDERARAKLKNYRIKARDICITIVGINIGDVGIVPDHLDDANLTENAVKLTNFRGLVPEFLNYYLQNPSLKDLMQQLSSGAAQGKLGLYKIKEIPVPAINFSIQEKIAAILSSYDKLIENNRRQIALLEKIAEEIYREWFVRMNFPGHELAKFEKGLPICWQVKKFTDIVDYYIGGGWGEERASTTFSDGAYVIRGTDIPDFNDGIFDAPYRYHKPSNLKSRTLMAGDFVFEVSGGSKDQLLGRNALISQKTIDFLGGPVICASFCKQIRFKKDIVSSLFMKYFMKLFYESDLVGLYQIQSTGISNYQFEAFLKFQSIIIPSQEIQKAFEIIIGPMTKLKDDLSLKNISLKKSRDLLLPRLISGKLSVDSLNIRFPPTMQVTD